MNIVETFHYKDCMVQIVPERHKGKHVFWFVIDGRPVNFVSKLDTAKRLACRFLDVVLQDEFMSTKQGFMASKFSGTA